MEIAIDTNILVRLIACDDEKNLLKAKSLVKKYGVKAIFVSYGVLLETYYVLKSVYNFTDEKLIDVIDDLLKIPQFSFEQEIPIRLAISKISQGFSFNDALFGEIAASRSIKVYTFDKGLKKNNNFIVL